MTGTSSSPASVCSSSKHYATQSFEAMDNSNVGASYAPSQSARTGKSRASPSPSSDSGLSRRCSFTTRNQSSKLSSSSPYKEYQTRGQHSASFSSSSASITSSRVQAPREQRHQGGQRAPVLDFQTTSSNNWTDEFRQRSQQPQAQLSDEADIPTESPLGPEIILAVSMRGRTLGCAYYDGHLAKLYVMQDMAECSTLEIIEIIKVQVRPTLILSSSRLDEVVMDALRFSECGEETKVEVLSGNDFSYSTARSKLVSVSTHMVNTVVGSVSSRSLDFMGAQRHSSEMHESSQRDAQIYLSNLIDMQSTESTFVIDSFMFINSNSLSSLQIFEDETHPSMHACLRGRKEGLSLYGVLDQTNTPQGRYLLKQWLLRPSIDPAVLHARHQTVECFTRTENQTTIGQLIDSLSHIKNIPRVLQALPRKATIAEWQAILQIYHVSREIFVGEAPIISQILQLFTVKDLMDIGANINDVVDFDESVIEGRCVVKHNVDEELDHMRQTYHGLDSFLSEIAKEISMTIPSDFASVINVIYFPQLGYLITVPRNPNWKTEQDFCFNGLSYQFCTDSTVYYKNNSMRELDEHLGDIHGLIVGKFIRDSYREIDIMHGLQERILEHRHFLVTCSDLCAELDVLVSLGQVARLRNYRRPKMTEQTILRIVNGRHPLQELVVNSFVANNTVLGDNAHYQADMDSDAKGVESLEATTGRSQSQSRRHEDEVENDIIILSGANSSGKSVYLKQVALITFMAHIGSFVPADSAIVGITDKILTRMQTRETVSSIQSAFMTDLQQVTLALRMATKRSLVALDEFGKGTTATDGAGLFCGLIEHFANIPSSNRPKVLATTHFHELFENNLLDLTLPISLYTMEVYQERNGLEATFLFRVIRGKTPASLGPACAAMAGMPPQIVQRGIELSSLFRRYEMIIPRLTAHERKVHTFYEKLTRRLAEDGVCHGGPALSEKRLQPAMSSCSSAFSELFEWFAEDAKQMEMELGYDVDGQVTAAKTRQDTDRGIEGSHDKESMEGNASQTSRATSGKRQRKRLAFSVIEELFECALDVDFVEHFGDDEESEEAEEKENEGLAQPEDDEGKTSLDLDGYEDLQELEVIDLTCDGK
ncbi:MutS protein msh5 [Mortierella alpina]|nr:MutS protein msh5 [Mortierella alpina]